MNWRGVKAALFRQIDIALPATLVRDVISRHGAQEWFIYAHVERSKRKHAWWPSLWLAARLTQSARILETGCGCGLNLIWFGQRGFKHLYGFDLDSKAIAAGHELFAAANLQAKLWTDDGLSPAFIPPERFDAIIALNWTYHVERFDLVQFLETYRQSLTRNGYLVIDLVDSSYDLVPNNQ